MKRSIIRFGLAALALSMAATASQAQQAQQKPAGVDINSATRTELKAVPGITNTIAGRIVTHRPYGSKAHLVSRGIISEELYGKIKDRVYVGLTPKDLEKVLSK